MSANLPSLARQAGPGSTDGSGQARSEPASAIAWNENLPATRSMAALTCFWVGMRRMEKSFLRASKSGLNFRLHLQKAPQQPPFDPPQSRAQPRVQEKP